MRIREQRVRIEDVAEAAGVSIMSVSRAMRGVEGVGQDTRARILNAAKTLGYQPSRVAASLSGANSTLIAISVPTLFEAVFAEILDGMRDVLIHAGFDTVIETSDYSVEREAAWVERMIAWAPAGLVLSGVAHDERIRARLATSGLPVLEVWDFADDPIDLCVGVDHRAAGLDMGRHLAALGYRRPAYVGVAAGRDARAEKRFAGLASGFAEAGAAFAADIRMDDAASFQAGFEGAGRALAALSAPPDVICFLNDHMAFGGLMACAGQGLDAPEAIGVTGFNGLNINAVLPKSLTTSITPRRRMGGIAARQLIARIRGVSDAPAVKLPVKLFAGETTRAQRARPE
ncbi:MAG: LacI family DNA-binding transcriptional regulator [Pseudomonadota bacterium]